MFLHLAQTLFVVALLHPSPAQSILKVRYPPNQSDQDKRADYDRDVVQLLLDKTKEKYGPYQLVPSEPMTQARAIESLKARQYVDVLVSTSNSERERELRPIRQGIHKGLMGVRLLLIRKGEQERFSRIQKVEELQKLAAGQGHDWPDVAILRANGFAVATGPTYDGLFRMLAAKRFDYFPRSMAEIWDEADAHEKDGLVVEQSLAIVYPQPAYVFVNKRNEALARRLEEGWEIALKDGSFEKLFWGKHASSIQKAQLKNRRFFFIKNPLLPNGDQKVDLTIAL